MTAEPLKPDRCPFCKSNYTDIFSQKFIVSNLPSGEASINHVECKSCRCHGPIGDTVYAAIAAWNRREPIGNSDELPGWLRDKIMALYTFPDSYVGEAWNDALDAVLSLKKGGD